MLTKNITKTRIEYVVEGGVITEIHKQDLWEVKDGDVLVHAGRDQSELDLATLNAEFAAAGLTQQVTALTAERDALQTQVTTLGTEKTTLETEKAALQATADTVPALTSERDALKAERDSLAAEVAALKPPADINGIPQEVSMYQARAALVGAGLYDAVNAAVAASSDQLVTVAWEYATTVRRQSPFIQAMMPALNLDDATVDQLFVTASQIN